MQQQRLPSLINPPITFAHRGAKAHAPDNTIEAFQLALKLGASGLETDVWVTADNVVVCDHDGTIKRGLFRRTPIGSVTRADLPSHIPALTEVFEQCGTDYQLSIDLKDVESGPRVIETIHRAAPQMLQRTWLCDPDLDRLVTLREIDADVRLVHSVRLHNFDASPERHASRLAELSIDGINMRQPDWNGGLVTLFHRFDVATFMWDVQHEHHLRPAFRMGIDALYSDHVDRMHDAFTREIVNASGET